LNLQLQHVVIAVLLIWAAIHYTRQPQDESANTTRQIALSTTAFGDLPVQSATARAPFSYKEYRIQPLAEFQLRARVLSRENYTFDGGAKLSPIDLALGWQRMAQPEIYRALNITQGGRWYRYSWHDQPPIPLQEIIESSANMHLIPANETVERMLKQAKPASYIRLKGLLVEASTAQGWHWRSSLSRADSGDGSCELVFVEAAWVE
jgi:hypothetical protein